MALVGSYELLMWILRADAGPATDQAETDLDQEALAVYAASIEAGKALSQRKLAHRFGRSRRWAARIIEQAAQGGEQDSDQLAATGA